MSSSGYNILSFDIGIKNLAFAEVQVICNNSYASANTSNITRWGIINITEYSNDSKSTDDICQGLIRALDETFCPDTTIDTVLLENQPVQKNPTMKSIQMMIYTYFHVRKAHMGNVRDVRLMSAINKSKWLPTVPEFKDLVIEGLPAAEAKTAYKKNKQLSVQMVQALIKSGRLQTATTEVTDTLANAKKKDDLCDAALQAVKHILERKPDKALSSKAAKAGRGQNEASKT